MKRLKLIVVTVAAAVALSPPANAQVPELLPIPNRLDGHHREELAARRSQLEAQWNALVSRADDHDKECGKVPANTPLANKCRENMKLLQGQITAHIEAVNSFNEAVRGQRSSESTEHSDVGEPPKNYDKCTRWCRDQFLPDLDKVRSCIAANCRQTPVESPPVRQQRPLLVPLQRPAFPR